MSKEQDAAHSFEGFTPGPWSTENIDGSDVVFDPNHFCICEVGYQQYGNKANAKLIAAAPDLLAELTRLRSELQQAKQETANHIAVNSLLTDLANKLYKATSELQQEHELRKELVESVQKLIRVESFRGGFPYTTKVFESLIKKAKLKN